MEAGRPTEGEHTIGDMVERAARAGVIAPILNAVAMLDRRTQEVAFWPQQSVDEAR
ncbi:ketopantoate reductase C-terminal domain-containing protein [Bradyrhizobium sp. DASA03076]|uniref:ketopantoate reductase C-terminal domain-containing protein n=1 Tax=Bradyrhizobium sp. BLXBL-03 TaxID=3395916 RepID=UPI003F7120D5